MSVVGLDLSLTATGIATENGCLVVKTKRTGMERLAAIRNEIAVYVTHTALVVVEGYSFGSRNSQAHALGELGGVVRLMLHESMTNYVDVPPTVVKKFATGKGNADKDTVLAAAIRHGYEGSNNNTADAWWLRQMGLYAFGKSDVATTVFRDETIAKVDFNV